MGNVQSGSTLTRTTAALDSFVAELGGDIIYEKWYAVSPPVCHSTTQYHKHRPVSLSQDGKV